LAEYDWPDSIAIDRLDVAELPDGWDSYPHPTVTQAIGSAWLSKAEKAGLMVPSAASPLAIESVLLVNPLHPDSKQLRLLTKIEKIYSDRTFAGL
jgi:RES domain-containing protein